MVTQINSTPAKKYRYRMRQPQDQRDQFVLVHPRGHEVDPEWWAREYPKEAAELDRLEAAAKKRKPAMTPGA